MFRVAGVSVPFHCLRNGDWITAETPTLNTPIARSIRGKLGDYCLIDDGTLDTTLIEHFVHSPMSERPPASTTCTYPCFSFTSPLGTSRLPYITLWTTFFALLGWQSGNLSVCGLHSHLSLSSLSLSPGTLRLWNLCP
jgi:hypothetical protein